MAKTALAAPGSNTLPNAKFQPEIQPEGCASDAFIKAVKDGNLDLAKAIYEQDPDQATCTCEIVQLAAMRGNVELLDWTHSRTSDDCTNAFLHYTMERVCFKEGHLQVLKWIHDRAYRFAAPAMFRGATNSGNMETVLWIIDNYPDAYELSKCIRMDNVACYDNLHMIKWLHERDFFFSKTAMDTASENGFLEIVQWLHENRTDGCSTWAMDSAATFGHLDIVMFLHFHRIEGCTTVAMDLAAENGHLEVLQFLHHNRKEGCTTNAMDNASKVDVLEFLHEHRTEGCTDEIVAKAVAKSNVPVLEWLHANKSGLVDLEAIRALAQHISKQDVVEWVDSITAQEDAAKDATDVAQETQKEALSAGESHDGE